MGEANTHREVCFRKYDKECVACGSVGDIEVHHIDGNADNDGQHNLIPLCSDCHNAVEKHCWTDDVDAEIQSDKMMVRWLVKRKRACSPNSEGSSRKSNIVKVPDTVYEKAVEIRDEREFSSIGDAVRFLIRNGEHDV